MTLPTTATTTVASPALSTTGPTECRVPARAVRPAGVALLLGGPASFALHVLWRIGHGPTVVNEHGVVLGLTNDQWSHLAPLWAVPVALAVVVVMALHRSRTARAASWLTGAGLLLGAAAAWVWPLYSLGALSLGAGLACLSVTLWRGRVFARWLAVPPAVAVLALLPLVFWPGTTYAVEVTLAWVDVEPTDLPTLAQAVSWTTLGVALLRPGCRAAGAVIDPAGASASGVRRTGSSR